MGDMWYSMRQQQLGPDPDEVLARPRTGDDPTNPTYYKDRYEIEPWRILRHMGFLRGNAMKYIWRAGEKGSSSDEILDLRKAIWYLTKEVENLENNTALRQSPSTTSAETSS